MAHASGANEGIKNGLAETVTRERALVPIFTQSTTNVYVTTKRPSELQMNEVIAIPADVAVIENINGEIACYLRCPRANNPNLQFQRVLIFSILLELFNKIFG